jgi:hypothetical protein
MPASEKRKSCAEKLPQSCGFETRALIEQRIDFERKAMGGCFLMV